MPDTPSTIVTVSSLSAGTGLQGTGDGKVTVSSSVIIQVVKPLVIISVRALRVFLQTLLGLLGADQVNPQLLNASDFTHVLIKCASGAVAAAVICVIHNAIELLGKVDQSHPTLTM